MFFQLPIAWNRTHTHTHPSTDSLTYTSCNFASFSPNKTTIVRSHLLLFYCHFLEKVPHTQTLHVLLMKFLSFVLCRYFLCWCGCLIQRSVNACVLGACRHKRFLPVTFFPSFLRRRRVFESMLSTFVCNNEIFAHYYFAFFCVSVSPSSSVCVCVRERVWGARRQLQ